MSNLDKNIETINFNEKITDCISVLESLVNIGDIQTSEMFEVQLVNAIAPFVLCNKLIPMMRRDNTGQKHIVNVTAMEGKFYRFKKGDRHPHTNMAKAALNMLTHTSASGLAKDGIFRMLLIQAGLRMKTR